MAAPVFYNRFHTGTNTYKAGFTDSNTVTTTQAKLKKNISLRSGFTANEELTDTASVTVAPGAGG